MGFFSKKQKALYAMCNGKTVAMENVPDEVFSTKMMGEGIAILPNEGKVYSPCNGKVSMVMDSSKHAVGIENTDGVEVLIHVGLDTVNLMGEGFETHVRVGDIVETGDALVTFDKEGLKEKGISDITMLVVVEAGGHTLTKFHCDQDVTVKSSSVIEYK